MPDEAGGPLRLYHYTSPWHLPAILDDGLTRGDVPLTPTGGTNAVWLTGDPNPAVQGWAGGFKTAVRITVDLDSGDPRLVKWSDYATERGVDPGWHKILDQTGGGGANDWYLYFGRIPAETFESVEQLG